MAGYGVSLERVHFRTCRLSYSDVKGEVSVYVEESGIPEYDWIGAEPDFEVSPSRLREILPRIEAWAREHELRIKIFPPDQLGI